MPESFYLCNCGAVLSAGHHDTCCIHKVMFFLTEADIRLIRTGLEWMISECSKDPGECDTCRKATGIIEALGRLPGVVSSS